MRTSDDTILQHYGDYITSALQTEGGHLSIGRGGYAERTIMWSCEAPGPDPGYCGAGPLRIISRGLRSALRDAAKSQIIRPVQVPLGLFVTTAETHRPAGKR